MPANHVTDDHDCDDTSALAHPGRVEIPEDGLDNDCDPTSIVPTMLYDAFGTENATNGNWTLGYARDADPATFAPMTSYVPTPYSGVDAWNYPIVDSLTVYRNYTSSVIRYVQAFFPGTTLIVHPGAGHAAAMRWTAPAATECQIEVAFYGCDTTTTTAQAYASGTMFADGSINGSSESVSGAITQSFEAGETIDLIVDANGDKDWDSTCVDGYLMCR